MTSKILKGLLLAGVAYVALSAGQAEAAPLPSGWTSVGNAGTNTAADGDVTLAPGFSSYQWISTLNGIDGAGTLPVVARGAAHLVDQHLYDALVAPNPVNIPFILARLDSFLSAPPASEQKGHRS